jgi:pimeloyl-ACP methyl ester carboxylesterase
MCTAGATMMLRVNVFGFSRGACSALMLAQMLAAFDSTLVLNLCLFDPVPGNLVCSSFLDCCTASTARQVVDVYVWRKYFNFEV